MECYLSLNLSFYPRFLILVAILGGSFLDLIYYCTKKSVLKEYDHIGARKWGGGGQLPPPPGIEEGVFTLCCFATKYPKTFASAFGNYIIYEKWIFMSKKKIAKMLSIVPSAR